MSDTPKKEVKTTDGAEKKVDKKKESFFKKVGKFFREHRVELKKISWPTFKEVVKNTAITLVVVLIIGAIIWLFDWGVSALRDTLIYSVQGDVSASDTTDELTEEELQQLLDMFASASDATSGTDAAVPSATDAN